VDSTFYDSMTTFVDLPSNVLLHVTNATAALSESLTDEPIVVYESDNTKVYTLMPANNLNFAVIGQALATGKSEKGYALDTTTLKAAANQDLSPLEKTLSNCVLGSYLASAGAQIAVTTLSSIDLAAMIPPDLDVEELANEQIDNLKD